MRTTVLNLLCSPISFLKTLIKQTMGIIIPTLQILLLSFSCSVVSDPLSLHGLQHARLPCPSPSLRACSHSCPLSQRCHPTISFSVVPFSSCLQSLPASGSFQMSQFLHQEAKVSELQLQNQSFH